MNAAASTSTFGALAERYRALPRAMKWLVWLVVGLAAYFVLLEPIIWTLADLNDRSEKALAEIRRYAGPDSENRNMIRDGRKRWGDVLTPGDRSRILEAKNAMLGVLEAHHLTREFSMTERSASKLKGTESASSGVEYSRGPIELKFSAPPHVALAVIADLEMVPSIARIASIRIRRHTDRAEVEVTLVADAWFVEKGSGA